MRDVAKAAADVRGKMRYPSRKPPPLSFAAYDRAGSGAAEALSRSNAVDTADRVASTSPKQPGRGTATTTEIQQQRRVAGDESG
jgi:hypothetical protein